ncbi:Gx transporter family protein [Enterococcus hermanniensis]|uniref:Heptaprenyl diphosphate synthase component I n=1 Tax=Enterococcus hermanniensis TaxID=249189 RepID=A0A1L8TPS4_9ENTE|nr:Gx transporter family protein [Enterococcus hermanniensis]OJG46329.1 hypothetical protein RV04_GL001495 [Enterococcus hermanniensis]
MNTLHKHVFIALLAAQAILLSLIERLIPPVFAFAPGAKIGLANVVIIIALYTLSTKDSFFLVVLRLLLATLLGGTVMGLLYATVGGLLSFWGMLLLKRLPAPHFSVVGISAAGGFLHNLGQLVVAALLAKTWTILLYLPVLGSIGIVSGILSGILAKLLLDKWPHLSHKS